MLDGESAPLEAKSKGLAAIRKASHVSFQTVQSKPGYVPVTKLYIYVIISKSTVPSKSFAVHLGACKQFTTTVHYQFHGYKGTGVFSFNITLCTQIAHEGFGN